MTTVHGFLSEKIPSRERVTALFVTEIKVHLSAFALIILCTESFLLTKGEGYELSREAFATAFISFFLFYCVLENIFKLFVNSRVSTLLSLLPAVPLYLLLREHETWPFLGAAMILAALFRAAYAFMPQKETVLLCSVFVSDAWALYLFFAVHVLDGSYSTDRILFIILVVMTLAAFQKILFERKRDAFPFYYFVLIGIILLSVPMKREPIDWTPVVETGERLVDIIRSAADSVSYYMNSLFDDGSYTAGYSSLDVTGDRVGKDEKTQIILRTDEKPYYVFRDEETLKSMKVRRTLYLAGGRGVENERIVSFLELLHAHGADRDYASLFSKVSKVNVEYAFLETFDEIAPANSFRLTSGKEKIEEGVSAFRHKKGYSLESEYLDIDYGSPYLEDLIGDAVGSDNAAVQSRKSGNSEGSAGSSGLSYEDARDYTRRLYDFDLGSIMSREEYEEAAKGLPDESYTDTEGASGRMRDLANEITAGVPNNYDKCIRIESYLRQYAYSTNSAGGNNSGSNMSNARGMSDIADSFLFETGSGYCVHFTSSMVMLLRLSGIPARATVGYRYVFPFDEEDSYSISSSCAHIWPEAYLENVGWVPFEPTAAFMQASEFTWHRKAKTEASGKYEKGDENLPGAAVASGPDSTEEIIDLSGTVAGRIFRIAIPLILVIAVLLAALIIGTSAVSRFKYRYGTAETKLKMDVEMIKRSIKRQAEEKFADRGLLSDYVERAPDDMREDLKKVFKAYYRMIYGSDGEPVISAEENALAKRLREQLHEKRR